jgi:hypothetical protein
MKNTMSQTKAHSLPVFNSNDETIPLMACLTSAIFCGIALATTTLTIGYGPLVAFIAYSFGGSAALIGYVSFTAARSERTQSAAHFMLIGVTRR